MRQSSTLTLSGLIRLMAAVTDAAVAVKDSCHLFTFVSSVFMPLLRESGRL